ncbi:MAG: hypothetical protein FWH21_05425 [Kiritimatiellaeota bacterium]|nr:hypothetical protein [Kiritimatiellota bacterium]
MRKRIVHYLDVPFQRDMVIAESEGLDRRHLAVAIARIRINILTDANEPPVGFTHDGKPVFTFRFDADWTIVFAVETPPNGAIEVIRLISLGKCK